MNSIVYLSFASLVYITIITIVYFKKEKNTFSRNKYIF